MNDMENIKRKLLIKYPSFGPIIANTKIIENNNCLSNGIPTAATDGENIYYHKDILKQSEDKLLFYLSHEVSHIAFDHIYRSENKDKEIWNIATDAVINAFLKKDGLTLCDGVIDMPEAINYDAEELYDILLKKKNQSSKNNSNDQNGSSASSNQNENKGHDSHEMWEDKVKEKNSKQNGSSNNQGNKSDNSNQNGNGSNQRNQDEKDKSNNQGSSSNSQDKKDDNSNQNGNENNQSNQDEKDKSNNQDGSCNSQDNKSDNSKQNESGSNQNKKDDLNSKSNTDKGRSNVDNKDGKSDANNQKNSKVKENIERNKRMGERKVFEQNRIERKKQLEELRDNLAKQMTGAGTSTNESNLKVEDIGVAKPLIRWRRLLKENINFNVDWSYKNATIEDGVLTSHLEYLPSPLTEILLDTSGSISMTLLKNFLRECKNILMTSKVKVGCFDTKFYGFYPIRNLNDIDNMPFKGGGGTDFDVAVNAFSKRVENKIIFTDGCAPLPEKYLDAIWVVFGRYAFYPKGGKVIYINEEELKRLELRR